MSDDKTQILDEQGRGRSPGPHDGVMDTSQLATARRNVSSATQQLDAMIEQALGMGYRVTVAGVTITGPLEVKVEPRE